MRKFIISDLHGNGNIYDSVMAYLNNVNKDDEIVLYINGDLIDRGEDSARMLLDVQNRITNNKGFKITFLGGNHELMMYQSYLQIKDDNYSWSRTSDWFIGNGGNVTAYALEDMQTLEESYETIRFVSNLKIYHKFNETLDDKKIVLSHAMCPYIVKDKCDLKIKDNTFTVENLLWTRRIDLWCFEKNKVGSNDYFTIIGHTPVDKPEGYEYYEDDNAINIDGGCAPYAVGRTNYNHTPLVEIDSNNNRLIILTFNNSNEIIYGNYFESGKSFDIPEYELDNYKKYINKNVKTRKLSK